MESSFIKENKESILEQRIKMMELSIPDLAHTQMEKVPSEPQKPAKVAKEEAKIDVSMNQSLLQTKVSMQVPIYDLLNPSASTETPASQPQEF